MARNAGREQVDCKHCGAVFRATPRQVRDGAKYCSTACYAADRTGKGRGRYALPEERQCAACGVTFLAGGRGRAPKRQRFCSDACKLAARYRHGALAKEITETQAAYIAGFLDGEGSVILVMRRTSVAMYVSATNSNRAVLDWLAETSGVGGVNDHRAVGERHAATWAWRTSGDAAESLLRRILPYMIIKAEQARLAIETQERLRDPQLKADRSWHDAYRQRMKALNQRGPRAD